MSSFHIACPFQHAPCLEFAFDGAFVAFEKHHIHNPSIGKALRDNPEQHSQRLFLKDICRYRYRGIYRSKKQIIDKYLPGISAKETYKHKQVGKRRECRDDKMEDKQVWQRPGAQ